MTSALPDLFLPYQQRLALDVSQHALSVHEKSRRTGFTWAAAAVAAITAAAAAHAGGMDVLYMGYEREMTREFMGYVAEFAKTLQLAASELREDVFEHPERPDRSIGVFIIRFASGFEVRALPSVARALRGKQGLVILDEAAFMDDLDEVLKAALALLMWGGRVCVISTHNGETNPFNALIQDIRAGRRRGHVTRTTFDEAIAEGLFRRICLRAGKPWSQAAEDAWRQEILDTYRGNADEELHVIPNPASGVYLPRVLVEARADAAIPVVRWQPPKGYVMWPAATRAGALRQWVAEALTEPLRALDPAEPHAIGMDFARVRDLTVIWVLAIGRDMVRRTRLVIELRDTPHEEQRDILFHVAGSCPRKRGIKIDAGGNGSFIGEAALQRFGEALCEPVQLSEKWYREQMPPWKAAFEDGTITVPRDRDIIDDHCLVQLVRGVARVPDRRRTAEGEARHGDSAIASALAFWASRAQPEEYGYEPVDNPGWQRRGMAARDFMRPPQDDPPPGDQRGWMPAMRGGWL